MTHTWCSEKCSICSYQWTTDMLVECYATRWSAALMERHVLRRSHPPDALASGSCHTTAQLTVFARFACCPRPRLLVIHVRVHAYTTVTRIDSAKTSFDTRAGAGWYFVNHERDGTTVEQAEDERLRQAVLLNDHVQEVRRLGGEDATSLLEIRRLTAVQAATPSLKPGVTQTTQQPLAAPSERKRDHRHKSGKRSAFSGGDNTWGDWNFKVLSCVSVVDLQLC